MARLGRECEFHLRMNGKELLRKLGMTLWFFRIAILFACAYVWRRLLFRTTFIAITGSVGKTTCKELVTAALGGFAPTARTFRNENDYSGVPMTLLRVRPRHRFAAIEVAADGLGVMYRSAPLVRPDIAIVLRVTRNHMKHFRTLDNIATEKAALLAQLSPRGIALLNGDDPRVAAMAASVRHRVVWFGSSPSFDYWTEAASSNWPDRFSFVVHAGAEQAEVTTQLVGTHWSYSVLAAIAAAHLSGVPLADAASAVRQIEPVAGRMQPVRLPSGAIVVRDELDSSIDTLPPAFQAMEKASASRKILVLGGVSNSPRGPKVRFRRIGTEIARIFDVAVFLGETAEYGAHGAIAAGMNAGQVHAFFSPDDAERYLKAELREGDLVLLKGYMVDHLTRLAFALAGPIRCRKPRCEKMTLCDFCDELGAINLLPLVAASMRTGVSSPRPGTTEAG
jgi:UDP-N-acetylmuramoyl-tripeptide--D-alanyl-D-alanine ligase